MTYTESYQIKTAKERPSDYQIIAQRMAEGNSTVNSAMMLPTGSELGWNVIGAGLGAGAAYLLSKKLRREATKRQRSLDVILGALTGLVGANVLLSSSGDEKSGLSVRQTMRADRYMESIGKGDRDHSQPVNIPEPFEWNENTARGTVAGVALGGLGGAAFGPFADMFESHARKGQMAKATAEAAKMGLTGADAKEYVNGYMNLPKGKGNRVGIKARRWGNVADILAGGGLGGLIGFGGGALANMDAARVAEEKYGGGF